jgi:hypothetical protein
MRLPDLQSCTPASTAIEVRLATQCQFIRQTEGAYTYMINLDTSVDDIGINAVPGAVVVDIGII